MAECKGSKKRSSVFDPAVKYQKVEGRGSKDKGSDPDPVVKHHERRNAKSSKKHSKGGKSDFLGVHMAPVRWKDSCVAGIIKDVDTVTRGACHSGFVNDGGGVLSMHPSLVVMNGKGPVQAIHLFLGLNVASKTSVNVDNVKDAFEGCGAKGHSLYLERGSQKAERWSSVDVDDGMKTWESAIIRARGKDWVFPLLKAADDESKGHECSSGVSNGVPCRMDPLGWGNRRCPLGQLKIIVKIIVLTTISNSIFMAKEPTAGT